MANVENTELRTPKWMGLLLILTIGWFIFCGVLFWTEGSVRGLTLNAFGDFVGGVVGPVALLWVVFSVIQQSEDLRLQKIELRRHVEATRELAMIEREGLDHERQIRREEQERFAAEEEKALPIVRCHSTTSEFGKWIVSLVNTGGPFEIKYMVSGADPLIETDYALIGKVVKPGDVFSCILESEGLNIGDTLVVAIGIAFGRQRLGVIKLHGKLGPELSVAFMEKGLPNDKS